jgi:hypothetical protein
MEPHEPREITREEAWQITCHEAGHAIVGVRLQIPFLHVERGDGEQGEVEVGACPYECPDGDWTQDEISRWQTFYAGGAAAEKLMFDSHREYGSRRDEFLHSELEKRRLPVRSDGWDRDIQSAMALIDRESVQKVASELDRRKKLTEEQAYELLGCAPPWA